MLIISFWKRAMHKFCLAVVCLLCSAWPACRLTFVKSWNQLQLICSWPFRTHEFYTYFLLCLCMYIHHVNKTVTTKMNKRFLRIPCKLTNRHVRCYCLNQQFKKRRIINIYHQDEVSNGSDGMPVEIIRSYAPRQVCSQTVQYTDSVTLAGIYSIWDDTRGTSCDN